MVVGGEQRSKPRPLSDEVEQIQRLIEIQSQIVELARQNETTAQECAELRHELSEELRRTKPRSPRLKSWWRKFWPRWSPARIQERK